MSGVETDSSLQVASGHEPIDVELVELSKTYGDVLVLASTIPVYLAHRLTREEEGAAAIRGGGGVAEATAAP